MAFVLLKMDNKEDSEVLDALYPETQILENAEVWVGEKCNKCGESFPNRQSKQQHVKLKHGGTFVCEICGKSFSQRSGLTHHLPMHSDLKAFQCNVCGKSFRQRSGLTHHKQTHSEVKAFSCEICGKQFAQGSGLIHHKSTHSLVKNFACNFCGKKFAQRSGLAHHKNIHIKHQASSNSVQTSRISNINSVLSTNSTLSANILSDNDSIYKLKIEDTLIPTVITQPIEATVLTISTSISK